MLFPDILILMRGGGDLATGAGIRLVRAGFPLVSTELAQPLTVRRSVSFAAAVLTGAIEIEGVRAQRVDSLEEARKLAAAGVIAVIVDPSAEAMYALEPRILVDARMSKRDADMRLDHAPLAIGLGPGFTAGTNCHAVVETNRGHFLGRVYWEGPAEADTGKPGAVQGWEALRVLRAPASGILHAHAEIGDAVAEHQVVATVGGKAVAAPFPGVLRGIIADGTSVPAGLKIGDLDPRCRREHCFTISDKSLAVGGGVLEAVLTWLNRTGKPTR